MNLSFDENEFSNVFASVFENNSEPSREELKRNRFGKLSKARERTNASNGKPLVDFQGSPEIPNAAPRIMHTWRRHYGFWAVSYLTAIHSTSTKAPFGKAFTDTAERAG